MSSAYHIIAAGDEPAVLKVFSFLAKYFALCVAVYFHMNSPLEEGMIS
jgi:hypothetical protein